MAFLKNLIAGMAGSLALNLLHETLRKTGADVPKINLLGEEAINKTLSKIGTPIYNSKELYLTTLKADLISNAVYYSFIGGKRFWIWPKAIALGLSAGVGALTLPEPLGLDPTPVSKTNQTKVLTVGYYVFGAMIAAIVLRKLTKK